MKCALVLGLSLGLIGQGGPAFTAPDPTSPPVAVEAAADTSGGSAAGAQGEAEASASSEGATSTAEANSTADADAEGAAQNAEGAGTAQGGASSDGADAGSEADADAGGANPSGQVDGGVDAGAEAAAEGDASGPSPTTPPEEEATDDDVEELPEEAIDESLGAERSSRSLSTRSLSSGFNAGYIISDQNFYNGGSMSGSQIQTFLNQKIGRCTIGDPGRAPGSPWGNTTLAWSCLNGAKWSTANRAANAYCKAYRGGSQESSGAIIAKVSQACGISPRVLLVMLEKEQSLITDTWPTIRQFNYAMGYACPDSGPNNSANCDPSQTGFPQQVYRAAWQLKVYKAHPTSYNYRPYATNTIQWHPNAGCGTSRVYIENYATAALYIYTPYRPNQAALNAGWGEGDSCSSYGNRNFYQFYKSWFGSPNSAFPDVPPGSKFYTEIEWMAATGLSTGIKTSDGRTVYSPKGAVTREAMAAFLYRLEGANYKAPAKSPFADMKPGDKFYREITWMYAKGYSTGIKQGSQRIYAPKSQVSREAMAAFIYRLQGGKYTGPAKSPFADMRRGDKFYNEITWMYARGYTTGINQGGTRIYAPKNSVTREAMAAFIYRLEH